MQKLGRFMQELCGKTINVRLGDKQTETLQLSKAAAQQGGDAGSQSQRKRAKKNFKGQGTEAPVDENAPLTEMEKKRVLVQFLFLLRCMWLLLCDAWLMYGELRSVMVCTQKKRKQNEYIR